MGINYIPSQVDMIYISDLFSLFPTAGRERRKSCQAYQCHIPDSGPSSSQFHRIQGWMKQDARFVMADAVSIHQRPLVTIGRPRTDGELGTSSILKSLIDYAGARHSR